ncbi:MAG: NUDIX hydrolase [Clostridia bacterium]|nr:NUDIX hydrolase [Clostridia bacterium]
MNYEEKTTSRKNIYEGSVIKVDALTVSLPNGNEGKRDLVIHPGASAVIPINENGEMYMVRQYRKPLEKVSLEIPAGKLDPGEDPQVCAGRELKEETGLDAETVQHIVSIHTTPGFCNEVIHMYVATGLTEGESCADEDEFISAEKIAVPELIKMVLNHEITDAKSIIGILIADKVIKGEIKV